MRIKIPFGQAELPIDLEQKNIGEIIYPVNVKKKNEEKVIIDGLNNPIESPSFKDFLKGGKNILIIVNDGTRSTPTAKILDAIKNIIMDFPVKFLIATDVSRAPTEQECNLIFGKNYMYFGGQVFVHDSRKKEDLILLGKTRHKTPIYLNKLAIEADRIIVIGSVAPHYYAGFTGGRELIFPGIAGYESILANRKLAIDDNAIVLETENNPVFTDALDAVNTLKTDNIFSIQVVQDSQRNIYDVKTGELNASFLAAINSAREIYCVPIKSKYDVVVTVAPYPYDTDLYQSQVAVDNAKHVLKEKGILIFISECRNGIGKRAFFDLLMDAFSPEEAMMKIQEEYKLGYHKSAKIIGILQTAQIWALTNLNPDDLESIFIKPYDSIQDAFDSAIKEKGDDVKILFLMHGSITIPVIEEKKVFSVIKDLKF